MKQSIKEKKDKVDFKSLRESMKQKKKALGTNAIVRKD